MPDLTVRNTISRDLLPIPANVVPDGVRCVQLFIPDDLEHFAAFMGIVNLLAKWNSWQKDGTTNARDAAGAWHAALALGVRDCEGNEITEHECVDFLPDAHGVITYAPQNPFTQPDYKPEGYANVPFVVLGEPDLIEQALGLHKGDVLTGFLGIPVTTPALDDGLARFRVNVVGSGVVELHVLKIPLGGQILITQDDNPLTANIVSLYKDPNALPLELIAEIVIEVEFDTPGAHHVDVTFLARFNDELTFFTYGGGLRSVVLCGFDQTIQDAVDRFGGTVEIEDCMRLRISPDDSCIIQHECSPGVWEDWFDPRSCIASDVVTQPEAGGEVPLDGCREYTVTLRGNDRWILPVPVEGGYIITITEASGGWSQGGVSGWRCPSGGSYALGICGAVGAEGGSGYALPSAPPGRLIAEIDGAFYDAYNMVINVPSGTPSSDVYFQMNDTDIADNFGSVSFRVEVCNAGGEFWSSGAFDQSETSVETPFSTDPDRTYRVTIDGFVQHNPFNLAHVHDAVYSSADSWATHSEDLSIGMVLDGVRVPTLPYSASHHYVFVKNGTGSPFVFAAQFGTPQSAVGGSFSIIVESI